MALPKLETPTYKLKLPSTGKTISYRPFLVKEEKLLLMTKESKDVKEMMNMITRLIETCLVDEIDVSSLTSYDVEYIFLMLRSKSVGEDVEISIKCESCQKPFPFTINLEKDIHVEKPKKKIDNKIPLTDTVGVIVKEPTVSMLSKVDQNNPIDVLIGCIDAIYDEKTVHKVEDYSKSEVREFVEALNMKEIQKVQEFFENTPKLICDVEFNCSCGQKNNLKLQGLSDFF